MLSYEMKDLGVKVPQRKTSFWKKNVKAVPGWPSFKGDPSSFSCSTSFQDFQESVNDVWNIGDDELRILSDAKISKRVARSAAVNVINVHRHTAKRDSSVTSSVIPEEKKIKAIQRLATQRDFPVALSLTPSSIKPPTLSSPGTRKHFPGRPQLLRGNQPRRKYQLTLQEGESSKLEKFQQLLESSLPNIENLRQLSWSGIPAKIRAITWRFLSGYLPASLERRQQVLERKRLDYWNLVQQYYETERDESYQGTYRQIHIDVPRMSPVIALFQQKTVQEMFERILFIWAIRHPASGYVQGINDLVTPFYVVFLQEAIPPEADLETWDVSSLLKEQRDIIEADSFWCFTKFLDGIQDNYVFAQLGIQHKVNQLQELIQRVDGELHRHLHTNGIEYLQFSFRWMNNLLTRELPLHCTIRLWDTYLAESDGFSAFQLYLYAAFLLHWRRELLQERDFQGLMIMLQNLPTRNWTDSEIGVLVAEAYRLKFLFADAPNHLQSADG